MMSLVKTIVLFIVVFVVLVAILMTLLWILNELGIDTQKLILNPLPHSLKIRSQILDRLKAISELHTGIAVVQTIVTDTQGCKRRSRNVAGSGAVET